MAAEICVFVSYYITDVQAHDFVHGGISVRSDLQSVFWPLLVTNTEKMRTIQIGISMLVTGDVVNYGHILAGAVIAIIPAMMIYIIGQDYMIRGMTSGGVKG